ncbi:N-acetylmannosamine kinase [Devosia sp. Root436]|uniref:putative N-acetylmannosamine-6-phosphate 2-epimerase n=1 Tax=Devosia sp. Root436 TaxID=1736537 RepID=UPI0006F31FFE|nr:putative N-acetylmannosamine-6-phosphate 2-epimerase [Devosia sp. Root436]KQX42954.1 N-acetylmannosamine kinase [Devosia sp. Root436]
MPHNAQFLTDLQGGLIVSCQPVDDGPLDTISAIVAFAQAARNGGARALRIEGADNVAAVAGACDLPIIGIVKRDLPDSPVRITPFVGDVEALAAAGATVIAIDGTDRPRPVPVAELLAAIHAAGCLAMADLATEAEAKLAKQLGFDILGTTMSGYTGGPVPDAPDLDFVAACRRLGGVVVAEGRYNTPAAAASAIAAGASAVCVGSAITRTEHVTAWFRGAVDDAVSRSEATVLALDVGGTKTLAALVRNGKILDRQTIPTPLGVGTDAWFATIGALATGWQGRYAAVGAAVTGVVQDGHWSALNPRTLAIPDRTPLVQRLTALFGVPAIAVNDAQAAAWGEYRHGAGRAQDMVFITVSSGIGGGIVLQGRLLQGANGLAGSLGQTLGARGAERLETRASGFGIAASASALGHASTTHEVFAAVESGLPWAEALLDEAVEDLAVALGDLQRLIDPEVVVLGGGIGMLPQFRDRLITRLSMQPDRLRPAIRPAALGGDAGIVGIADLCHAP